MTDSDTHSLSIIIMLILYSSILDTSFYKIKEGIEYFVRFDVFIVMNIMRTVFWNMTPCSLVERYRTKQCHISEILNIVWFVSRLVMWQIGDWVNCLNITWERPRTNGWCAETHSRSRKWTRPKSVSGAVSGQLWSSLYVEQFGRQSVTAVLSTTTHPYCNPFSCI
jgi:hypothetical protein